MSTRHTISICKSFTFGMEILPFRNESLQFWAPNNNTINFEVLVLQKGLEK